MVSLDNTVFPYKDRTLSWFACNYKLYNASLWSRVPEEIHF